MEKAEESIGRFSALPDDVVRHILSFLPTKFSVATSILAKRWRFLWAHVPNLDLDSSYHQRGTTFSKFVNMIMLLHKAQSLYTFRLSCINNCSNYELGTWIMTAIARNVRNFDLSLCFPLRLPQCLFTWKTLVSLSLHYSVVVPSRFSGTICLSSLKKLHLYYASYPSDEALSHLLSGCPVLEELAIINNTVNVGLNLISWKDPERVPTCLLLHLRIIRIGPIVCVKHEFNMVRYLVRNAKVLEKMELRLVHCLKAKVDVVRRILLLERGSEACELALD